MARSIKSLAVGAAVAAIAVAVATSVVEKPARRVGRGTRTAPASGEPDAARKRKRKNALRLKQAFHDHKPTNHSGREFIGCDERRKQLAERKAVLFEHGAAAARMRHRPERALNRRYEGKTLRASRAEG